MPPLSYLQYYYHCEDFNIKNGVEEKIVGIKFDTKLSLENHVPSVHKGKSEITCPCTNLKPYGHRKTSMYNESIYASQFSYCPLVWTFHRTTLNIRINKIHERALGLVCQNNTLYFTDLLERGNSVTIHERNLQLLATKIFKPRIVLTLHSFRSEAQSL